MKKMKKINFICTLGLLSLLCNCSSVKHNVIKSDYIPAGYSIDGKTIIKIELPSKINKNNDVYFSITNNIAREELDKAFEECKNREYVTDYDTKLNKNIKKCFVVGKLDKKTHQIFLNSMLCSNSSEDKYFLAALNMMTPTLATRLYDTVSVQGFVEIDGNKKIKQFPIQEDKEVKLIFTNAVKPIYFSELNSTIHRVGSGNGWDFIQHVKNLHRNEVLDKTNIKINMNDK
jgi:hypothetical protein